MIENSKIQCKIFYTTYKLKTELHSTYCLFRICNLPLLYSCRESHWALQWQSALKDRLFRLYSHLEDLQQY